MALKGLSDKEIGGLKDTLIMGILEEVACNTPGGVPGGRMVACH